MGKNKFLGSCQKHEAFFLFLSLFNLTFYGSTAQNLIQPTSSLQAAPASQRATLPGIGMTSIRLVQYNVSDTMSHVKMLLLKDKQLDSHNTSCLKACLEVYSNAIASIKHATKSYNTKQYYDANIQISAVIADATTCEDGFMEKQGGVSPLTKRNDNTIQLSSVALSVVNFMFYNRSMEFKLTR
ncbi:putative invertase inhibitor [Solanum lycopersicum]|uniref:putative invertase inhibitor n=1 Tax=Solanum lycopersicum TaxID=4081 RepID=UPI0008FED223|nr:putative invertase inhibitor [Solanum lycopersicum]